MLSVPATGRAGHRLYSEAPGGAGAASPPPLKGPQPGSCPLAAGAGATQQQGPADQAAAGQPRDAVQAGVSRSAENDRADQLMNEAPQVGVLQMSAPGTIL